MYTDGVGARVVFETTGFATPLLALLWPEQTRGAVDAEDLGNPDASYAPGGLHDPGTVEMEIVWDPLCDDLMQEGTQKVTVYYPKRPGEPIGAARFFYGFVRNEQNPTLDADGRLTQTLSWQLIYDINEEPPAEPIGYLRFAQDGPIPEPIQTASNFTNGLSMVCHLRVNESWDTDREPHLLSNDIATFNQDERRRIYFAYDTDRWYLYAYRYFRYTRWDATSILDGNWHTVGISYAVDPADALLVVDGSAVTVDAYYGSPLAWNATNHPWLYWFHDMREYQDTYSPYLMANTLNDADVYDVRAYDAFLTEAQLAEQSDYDSTPLASCANRYELTSGGKSQVDTIASLAMSLRTSYNGPADPAENDGVRWQKCLAYAGRYYDERRTRSNTTWSNDDRTFYSGNLSTIVSDATVAGSGKWYAEIMFWGSTNTWLGISRQPGSSDGGTRMGNPDYSPPGWPTSGAPNVPGWSYHCSNGNVANGTNTTGTSYGTALSDTDVLSILVDFDTPDLRFWKNGVDLGTVPVNASYPLTDLLLYRWRICAALQGYVTEATLIPANGNYTMPAGYRYWGQA